MNFVPGRRAFEIITGPGNITQRAFENFSAEYDYKVTIDSPEPGRLVIYLIDEDQKPITNREDYDVFLNKFLLLDERFHQYREGEATKWTVRIVDSATGPGIEAFYI